MAKLFWLFCFNCCFVVIFYTRKINGFINHNQQQKLDILNGATVLNPPFIYSESGPYRGFCVDVLKELSQMLKFQFTLRQSFDGQIGSVYNRDGVFGEIIEKYVEFAIGDISSNWLNNKTVAEHNGILFTRPIYISTMKVLLTKTLHQDLLDRKRQSCMKQKKNILSTNETNGEHYQEDCSKDPLTIHDIFNAPDLVRVIFKGGAVHRFYSTINIDYLNDLIIVERASLSTLLSRLQKQNYVLIDESKFIDYFVDQDCQYTSIDVARNLDKHKNYNNVYFDHVNDAFQQTSFSSLGQQLTIRKEELFQNNIAIAFSKNFIESYNNNNNNENQETTKQNFNRNWLIEFDKSIEMLEKSSVLKKLREKHWSNNCRRKQANNSAYDLTRCSLLVNTLIFSITVFSLYLYFNYLIH